MKKKSMQDIIAEGIWKNPDPKAKKRTAYIAIGRPQPDDTSKHKDWKCPIYIEHFTQGVIDAHGIGPLDALMNAMTLLRQFLDMHHYIEPVS
jgi:hypothetical protein